MSSALLLDRNYMPLSIIDWKRVAKLLVSNKAEPASENIVKNVKTISREYPIPSIIRLVIFTPWKSYHDKVKFSRKNMMMRDRYTCQYCGKNLGKSSGTIDHVVPKSKGGRTDYKNCVACCKSCNSYKGNLTLERAGMRLIKVPKNPTFLSIHEDRLRGECPKEWFDYIIGV